MIGTGTGVGIKIEIEIEIEIANTTVIAAILVVTSLIPMNCPINTPKKNPMLSFTSTKWTTALSVIIQPDEHAHVASQTGVAPSNSTKLMTTMAIDLWRNSFDSQRSVRFVTYSYGDLARRVISV